jgi:hypothetical protein
VGARDNFSGFAMTDRKKAPLLLFQVALTELSGALICVLPLLPLLDFRSTFYIDWFNHIWLIQYFGEYLGHHYCFPEVISTGPQRILIFAPLGPYCRAVNTAIASGNLCRFAGPP